MHNTKSNFLFGLLDSALIFIVLFSIFLASSAARSSLRILQPSTPPSIIEDLTGTDGLTPTSVELVSAIAPGDSQTTGWFEWGTTTAYGETAYAATPPGYMAYSGKRIAASLQNLSPRTTYHYRAVARNDAGIAIGRDHLFVTLLNDQPPTVTILGADSVTSRSARLRILCNPHGSLCSGSFVWGRSISEDSSTVYGFPGVIGDDTLDTEFSETVGPLMPNQTYYFRARVSRTYSGDEWVSTDFKSFTSGSDTDAVALVIPLGVARHGSSGSTIRLGVHSYATSCSDPGLGEWQLPPRAPEGSMDTRFIGRCMGLGLYLDLRNYHSPAQIDTYHVSFLSGGFGYPVTVSWPDLESLYAGPVTMTTMDETVDMLAATHYSISNPEIEDLRIIAAGPKPRRICPSISGEAAASASATTAHLSATIYSNGFQTLAWFQWGTSQQYGHETAAEIVSDTTRAVTLEVDLTGLEQHSVYHYRVAAKNLGGTVYGADQVITTGGARGSDIPARFELHQNHPNPFNPSTVIRYDLPVEGRVVIRIFDILGRETRILDEGVQDPGFQSIIFDGSGLSSGLYLYRITAGGFTDTKKMLLMK